MIVDVSDHTSRNVNACTPINQLIYPTLQISPFYFKLTSMHAQFTIKLYIDNDTFVKTMSYLIEPQASEYGSGCNHRYNSLYAAMRRVNNGTWRHIIGFLDIEIQKSITLHRDFSVDFSDFCGFLWISVDFCGFLWISQISVDFYGLLGFLWISMDFLYICIQIIFGISGCIMAFVFLDFTWISGEF